MAARSGAGMVLNTFAKYLAEAKGFDRVLRNIKPVSGSKGKCVFEMTVDESHLNGGGTLHGGLTATIVDGISTAAIMTAESHPGVSVDMNISYLNAAREGDVLEIKSDCIKKGKRLAFATVEIARRSDGSVIALGRHTKALPS